MSQRKVYSSPRRLVLDTLVITAFLVSYHLSPNFIPYQTHAAFVTAPSNNNGNNNYPLMREGLNFEKYVGNNKADRFIGATPPFSTRTQAGRLSSNACRQRSRRFESITTLTAFKGSTRRNDNGNDKTNQLKPRQETNIERNSRQSKRRRINDKVQMRVKRLLERNHRGDTITQYECDLAIGLCYAADAWYYVQTILDLMNKNGIKEERSTFRACLSECFNAGNGLSALKVLDKMEDAMFTLDAEDVRLIVLALCRNNKDEPGMWRNALELLLQYAANKREGEASHEVTDVVSYNAVLNCIGEEQAWEDSIRLLKLMEQGFNTTHQNTTAKYNHPIPNVATYHAVLNALTASKGNQAIQIIKSMPGKGIKPTVYTFELTLPTLLKDHKHLERAVELLDMMHDLNIVSPTPNYNKAISALARVGQLGSATSLLSKMKERKIERDTVTFNALISACANKGQATNALRLLNECKEEKSVEPDIITYTNTIRACARGKMTQRALELLDEVKEKGLPLDAYVYTAAIDACAKGRLWREALHVLGDMKLNGVIPNDFTYSAAITACGNGGQWERALALVDKMREEEMRISTVTYNAAISALAKASRSNARRSTDRSISEDIGTAKESARYIEGGIDGSQLWRKALELIEQMKEDEAWPDVYSYSGAISACGSGGCFEEALQLIKIMQKGPLKSRPNKIAYTGAISACARCGEWAPALQLFDSMRADRIVCDTVSYNALLSALVNGGQADMAYDTWNEMCGKKGSIGKNVVPDIISLTSVIASLERANGKDKEEKMDEVFATAVERQIILPEDTMDTKWEIDLSGMSLPVSRAACRFIITRLQQETKAEDCQDLMLITGVGVHHYQAEYFRKQDDNNFEGNDKEGDEVGNSRERESSDGKRTPGTTALREYIRQILRQDFEPPIYSVVPNNAVGVVQVKKELLQKWILNREQKH